jgi:hypothetical protein
MGQQSGHWAFAASIPFAVAIMALFLTAADDNASAGATLPPLSLTSLIRTHSRLQQLPDCSRSVAVLIDSSDSAPVADCQFVLTVPANSLLVVGSLDLSGASHTVVFDSDHAPTRANHSDRQGVHLSAGYLRLSASAVKAPVVAEPAYDSQSKLECVKFDSRNFADVSVKTRFARTGQLVRNFLVPHFEQGTIGDEIAEGILVAQSTRVSVFLDQSLCQSAELRDEGGENPFVEHAREICQRLEQGLLDHVSSWIGEVTDLDGDTRLTLIITDLDRRESPADRPVLGCVRDRDFLRSHDSDLSGDILYLDRRLPSGDSLIALLAHEITHAAVFSLLLESRAGVKTDSAPQFPSWLNESIAHIVENSVCDVSTDFSERVQQFHANTAASPIVATEPHLPFAARRGGSRASGTLFLQHLALEPETLRSVIRSHDPIEQRLEFLTRNSFGEAFRAWSVRQIHVAERKRSARNRRSLTQGDCVSQRLFGTAYCCFRCNRSVQDLRITSDNKAALQITVIESPAVDGQPEQKH